MRRIALAALLSLAACVAVTAESPPPAGPPPPPPVAAPAPPTVLTRDQAVGAAFDIARERGLQVTTVRYARLDGAGRWHVELRGERDRARVLLDGRDGKLLKGKFRESDAEPE